MQCSERDSQTLLYLLFLFFFYFILTSSLSIIPFSSAFFPNIFFPESRHFSNLPLFLAFLFLSVASLSNLVEWTVVFF